MEKLEIVAIDDNNMYNLKSETKMYQVIMYFYDVEKEPNKHDIIYLNEEMLNEKIELRFSNLESAYGRKISDENDKDLMILVGEDNIKHIYKRIYG